MPELPEVTTTVNGLNTVLPGLTIRDAWTDYHVRTTHKRTDTIKNKDFFARFKAEVVGEKFLNSERRGKHILIHLSHNKTILIHMKMTGHLLYGPYSWNGTAWTSTDEHLADPFNQFIHLAFTLSNDKHLVFSDMRKFATVTLFETNKRHEIVSLKNLGPEPLEKMTFAVFSKQLDKRPRGKIKTVLMDQTVVAGIGNIYSDEILWAAGIHPEEQVARISPADRMLMWKAVSKILHESIRMGGDSMSDYRNIYGKRGNFQNSHKAYRQTKKQCQKPGCNGIIIRKIVGGRSAHFCDTHQQMKKK